MNKSLFKNMLFNFIKTLSGTIFPIITFAYASHILGADGIGKVNFVKAFISYFTVLALLGMKYYGSREVAKCRNNKQELSKFVHEMLIINGIMTVLAYVLLVIAILLSSKLQGYKELLILNSGAILLTGLGMEWLYQGLEEYQYISVRAMVFQIIAFVLMLALVRNETDVIGYAFVCLLSTSGSYIFNFIYARKFITFHKQKIYELKKHMKPILWLFAMEVSIEFYTTLDTTMLGFFQNDTSVGKYTVACRINRMVCRLLMALAAVFSPRIVYYLKERKEKEVVGLIRRVYRLVFLLSIPIEIGLFFLSKEVIQILSGNGFVSTVYTMQILTLVIGFSIFNATTNDQIFVSLGKEKLIVISTGVGAIVNFICNLLLIPRFAENGAAIATVLAEGVVSVISFCFVKRELKTEKLWRGCWQYGVAAIPIVILGILTKGMGILSRICVMLPLAAGGYFGILLIVKNECILEVLEFCKDKCSKSKKVH